MYLLRTTAFLLSLSLLFAQEEITIEDLYQRDGLFYAPGQDSTFSGNVIGNWENGIKKEKGYYKNGKFDRITTSWYDNGQKSFEGTYKDGKRDGLWTSWYENGEKKSEGAFTGGDLFNRNIGRWVFYDKKGRITSEKNY